MGELLILYGAGATGWYVLRHLRARGIEPIAIVDSDPTKWGQIFHGIEITSPHGAKRLYPNAIWIACAISRPAAPEIRDRILALEVSTKPLWEYLPVCHGVPSKDVIDTLDYLAGDDKQTRLEIYNQVRFRGCPDYAIQPDPSDVKDIYFPEFIRHLDNEHFADCGAAGGDTVAAFLTRWHSYSQITAFEPDPKNLSILRNLTWSNPHILRFEAAVSDHFHTARFQASGDYSSHLDPAGEIKVSCWHLDDLYAASDIFPTYIKLDIEGSELEALWGARRLLKKHKPVLAVCAYHTSEHLWEIPLLIYAIQPGYKLYLRRYAEGAFELVWYAVPPERVQ